MYVQCCDIQIQGEEAIITGKSVFSGTPYSVKCREKDLRRYIGGELVQNCFPYLSSDDREFLISGIIPEDWKEIFGEEDET